MKTTTAMRRGRKAALAFEKGQTLTGGRQTVKPVNPYNGEELRAQWQEGYDSVTPFAQATGVNWLAQLAEAEGLK